MEARGESDIKIKMIQVLNNLKQKKIVSLANANIKKPLFFFRTNAECFNRFCFAHLIIHKALPRLEYGIGSPRSSERVGTRSTWDTAAD